MGRRRGGRRSKRRSTRSKSKASKSKKKSSRRRSTASSKRKSVRSKAKAKRTARKKKAKATTSKKRTTKKRSTAASKRKSVRSAAKAKRAAKRTAKASPSSSTSSSSNNKTKRKPKKLGRLNKRDRQQQNAENAKKAFKKKNEQQNQQNKKQTISASQKRKQVRQNTKDKISTRKKLTFGAPANATTNTNTPKRNKFQQQLSNLRKDIAQKSTKEARFQRRKDRMSRMTGRDYDNMKPSFTVKANIDQAARKFGFHNNRFYKALPKAVKNFRFNATVKAPGKLSIRQKRLRGWKPGDGDRRRTGGGVRRRQLRQERMLPMTPDIPIAAENPNNQDSLNKYKLEQMKQREAWEKNLRSQYETKFGNQRSTFDRRLADQQAGFNTRFGQQQEGFNTRFGQQQSAFNTQLGNLRSGYDRRLSEQQTGFSTQLGNLKSGYDQRIGDLRNQFDTRYGQLEGKFGDLESRYKQKETDYTNLLAQARYGNKTVNRSVKGVRTQAELPGFQDRNRGTVGQFGRRGRGFRRRGKSKGSGLKIGSLNLA